MISYKEEDPAGEEHLQEHLGMYVMNRKQRKMHDVNYILDLISMVLWLISGVIDWDYIPIPMAVIWVILMTLFLLVRVIYAEFIINW